MCYNPALADRVVNFVSCLKHVEAEWAGKPFRLAPWQENEIIRPLFGTVNAEGIRQYRTAYIEIPRKNGKTSLLAALVLYLLCADGEHGAQIYSAASDQEQASIIFRIASQMIHSCPALAKKCKVIESTKRIIYHPTNSFYHALSAEAFSKHGYNPHAVVYDELHAAPNRDLWDVLQTSMGARRQPLMIAITTAGYDRETICYEQHDYAERLLNGSHVDPTYFPFIRGAAREDDWKDPAVWAKANPNLGVSVKMEFLQAECNKAVAIPAYQNTFRRLFLNQWTEQNTIWLDMDVWKASAGSIPSDDKLFGRSCYAALDLSSTTDLSAFLMVFPWDDGSFKLVPHFWIPAENIRERMNRDRVPYDAWVRDGLVTATPGNVIDYAYIKAHILKAASKHQIQELAFDRWGAIKLVTELQDEGMTVIPFGQGFASMSGASKEFQKYVLEKKLHHGNNPVLNWMAGNVAVRQDPAGNIKPDKASSKSRIDGIVASIMALDRAVRHATGPSVYENRGIVVL